jgi:histidinol-phosphate phosphatase family protein
MERRRAVFLDKDGTIIENVPYNVDPERIRLNPGADIGLKQLHGAGYLLFVVSNQAGVARGYFPESALEAVEARLRVLLAAFGVPLAGFTYCPHHPEGSVEGLAMACDCRKPAPGMIVRTAAEHGIDLARSWMIGDILDDVQAGRNAGCRTILIDNGGETKSILSPDREPHYRASDMAEAARYILRQDDPESLVIPDTNVRPHASARRGV